MSEIKHADESRRWPADSNDSDKDGEAVRPTQVDPEPTAETQEGAASVERDLAEEHEILRAGERIASHVVAILTGTVLGILGFGFSFTVVFLPVALPIGILGAILLAWGLFDWSRAKSR